MGVSKNQGSTQGLELREQWRIDLKNTGNDMDIWNIYWMMGVRVSQKQGYVCWGPYNQTYFGGR